MPFATGPQPPPSCRTSVRYMRQCAALNMPRYVHCGVVTDHDSRLQSASYQLRLGDCNQRGLNAEFKGVGRMANYNHRRGIRMTWGVGGRDRAGLQSAVFPCAGTCVPRAPAWDRYAVLAAAREVMLDERAWRHGGRTDRSPRSPRPPPLPPPPPPP